MAIDLNEVLAQILRNQVQIMKAKTPEQRNAIIDETNEIIEELEKSE